MFWLYSVYYIVFDSVFYNLTKKEDYGAPTYYRVMQVIFCWLPALYFLTPLEFAQFFLLWWTFVFDWGYYAIEIIVNPRHTKEDFANGITHAHWTPYGLIVNRFKTKAIPVSILIIQSVIGLTVTYFIGE